LSSAYIFVCTDEKLHDGTDDNALDEDGDHPSHHEDNEGEGDLNEGETAEPEDEERVTARYSIVTSTERTACFFP
jgi:hypothetical protein